MKVLHLDEHILVLDKPAAIAVHPGNMKGTEKTVVDFIRDQVSDPDPERPGIVHRLDKDTSGVLVIARNRMAKQSLKAQFQQRQVQKNYLAAVVGVPNPSAARIELPIGRHPKNPLKHCVRAGGKPAITEYETIETKGSMCLLGVRIMSGRTHQIRVHLAYLGHPVLGDRLYGSARPGLSRQFLHAHQLEFTHPASGGRVKFTSRLPRELHEFWYNH